MTTLKFSVLFILTILGYQSNEVCAAAFDGADPLLPETASLSHQVDQLRVDLRNIVKENEVTGLNDIFTRFKTIDASDSDWEELAATHHCIRWSSRQSWQDAVSSHILVMESIEPVYWSLIAQKSRESASLPRAVDWLETFHTTINQIFEVHPVTCKRVTMYLLAMVSNQYQSPIAQIMTANHLKILNERGKEPQKILQIVRLNFDQQDKWQQFLDTLPTTPINEEAIAYHSVELGMDIDPSFKLLTSYDETKVNAAIEYYCKAGEKGDYEGYLRAALLQKQLMRKNGTTEKGINKMLTYLKLSLILGNPDSSEEFRENMLKICPEDMQEELLEDWENLERKATSTRPSLYKQIRKIMTSK